MKLLKPSLGTYSEWILLLSQLRIFRQPLGNLHIFTPRAYKNPILFGRFRICQVETLQVDLPRCRLYFIIIIIIIIRFIVEAAVFFLFFLRALFRQGQVTVEAVCLEDFQGTFSSGL